MNKATGIEALVCADIAARQKLGIAKYGTTVAGNPLALDGWHQHAYEEAIDLAIYLKRAIVEAKMRRATQESGRTDQEILDQTNDLAREFYALEGHEVKKGYRFDRAHHPHEICMWRMACAAQLELTSTDIEDVLAELEEEEE